MSLSTLKPRLSVGSLTRTPVLQTKAGTTEMERGRAWMAKRQRVAQRFNYICQGPGCGLVWRSDRDQIDHRIPREQGGSNDESNLQPLCLECHRIKTDEETARRTKGY